LFHQVLQQCENDISNPGAPRFLIRDGRAGDGFMMENVFNGMGERK
jgi:hypothetical protein